MSFTHPQLDLIAALYCCFIFSPFLGGGRWTTADVGGAGGRKLGATKKALDHRHATTYPLKWLDAILVNKTGLSAKVAALLQHNRIFPCRRSPVRCLKYLRRRSHLMPRFPLPHRAQVQDRGLSHRRHRSHLQLHKRPRSCTSLRYHVQYLVRLR
jgi:hypothetical protein